MKLGAIEAGGTKFVVCIGNEKGEVLERESFPTEAPEKTMENVFKFFDGKEIEALGVGSFGPIDPDLTSPTYGYITTTPKPGWNNYNIMGALKERYDIPMAFDTDVNGAALGEATFGAAKGLDKDEKDKEGKYIRRERYAGACQRSYYVGEDITEEDIKAEFKHGVLKV